MRLGSERIVTPAGTISGEVVIAGGRITGVGTGARGRDRGDAVDLGQRWIVPGFIDTHVHGGGGGQFNTLDPGEIRTVARLHAEHGTTALLATTVSAPVDELVGCLETIAEVTSAGAQGDGAVVLGAHLEGPFISPEWQGAMDPDTFLEPQADVVDRLLRAGCVRWMTLAPELPGGLGLVKRVVDAGAVASVGHSDASYEQVQAAVAAGVSAATHTFNAMRPLHHRDPGVVGAILDLEAVSCELICDGIHVSPPVLRLVHRAKGLDGLRLVTDAMQASGMGDGDYLLGSLKVSVRDGRAELSDGSGAIAGSTLTMGEAVRNAVRFLGVALEDAIVMAAQNPARMLGLAERKGAIAAGMDADLVVLDEDLGVCGTLVEGSWVYGPTAAP